MTKYLNNDEYIMSDTESHESVEIYKRMLL